MSDYIDRDSAIAALEKALFEYEDETEQAFIDDPELDLAEWFFHRIFVQVMNGKDRQAVLNLPAANVRPVVLCRDCMHTDYAGMPEGRTWCCEMERAMSETEFCSRGKRWEDNANDV